MLGIAEMADEPFQDTPWAGPLVALGARALRYVTDATRLTSTEQLFVAVTVPVRDLAASLIAAGWMMTAPVQQCGSVEDQLRTLTPGSMVRMITNTYMILNKYHGLEGGIVHVGRRFHPNKVAAISAISSADAEPRESMVPAPPGFGPYMERPDLWAEFLCQPPSGLAIVGSKSALLRDMRSIVNTTGRQPSPTRLSDIVLPREGKPTTWATDLITPSQLSDDLDDVPEYRAVILDGASAVKSVDLIDAPLVIAVIDRSVMDDAAAELVAQRRNNPRSNALSPIRDLEWRPPGGVEIVAFRTRR